MKHVHVLPTDKPSRLFKDDFGNFIYSINIDQEQNHFEPQHLFIISDEEIKEGDWIFNEEREPSVLQCIGQGSLRGWNKIILTTDSDLIKDGVQPIDDEFLEWFVNNPSCEEVDVKPMLSNNGRVFYGYKIIIPQEEPKQETLEEASKDYIENTMKFSFNSLDTKTQANRMLKCAEFGAKWQAERMYSKEDLKEVYFSAIKSTGEGRNGECASGNSPVDIKKEFNEEFEEWFEQFKKK